MLRNNFQAVGINDPDRMVSGPDGALWFTNYGNTTIGRITTSGTVSNFTCTGVGPQISNPRGIEFGTDGNLWFTNRGNGTIGRITPAGVVTIFSWGGISDPLDIAAGPDGAMWFTNWYNSSIDRITTSTTPIVGGFSPKSGPVGTTVVIVGHNLSGATKVRFNGTTAKVSSDSAVDVVCHGAFGRHDRTNICNGERRYRSQRRLVHGEALGLSSRGSGTGRAVRRADSLAGPDRRCCDPLMTAGRAFARCTPVGMTKVSAPRGLAGRSPREATLPAQSCCWLPWMDDNSHLLCDAADQS